MKDLIQALTIFAKYGDPYSPTHCEHDELIILIDPSLVTEEDARHLEKLGFGRYGEHDYFSSFRFGCG